jgi:hypothetical protein
VVFSFIFASLAFTSFSILRASFFGKGQLSGITVTIVVLIIGIITQLISKWMSNGAVPILGLLITNIGRRVRVQALPQLDAFQYPLQLRRNLRG